VQDKNVLFMISILRVKRSFKVCSSGPRLSGATGKIALLLIQRWQQPRGGCNQKWPRRIPTEKS